MAKFLKVHTKDEYDGSIEEKILNLETIEMVSEKDHCLELMDGCYVHMARSNEWEKLMSFVKANEL